MLGHDLVETFSGDYEVTAWDIDDCDLTNKELVVQKITELQPDAIVNAAAYTAVDQAEEDEATAQKVNGEAVGNVAAAAKELDIPVVHVSTDYVFEGTNEQGYNEEDPTGPQNAYGRTKLAGEEALMNGHNKGYVVRTAWLYGHHGGNFVETMMKLAAEKDELKVVNDQHGSPTFTKDLAKQIRVLLEGIEAGEYEPGIFHATNSDATTWHDFAAEIFRLTNAEIDLSPCTTEEFPRPAKRPEWSVLNNNKLPSMRSWKEALAEYIETRQDTK